MLPMGSGPAQAFAFSPSSGEGQRLASFVADSRDSLQRVVAPAEVSLFDLDLSRGRWCVGQAGPVPVQFGQQADLLWSPTGAALLAHCQTDVDDTGKSYYGGSKLVLISKDGNSVMDFTEGEASTVQAVAWSPTRDEFVLVQGFQPAEVKCWAWDEETQTCRPAGVLQERAHRNTIRWNPFGTLVCVAGFGNLAGEVDFFGRVTESGGLRRLCSCEASCTVSADWAPDGRHFMTAVLAPRMRVDNGLAVWSALTGAKITELMFDELFEVQWKPPGHADFSPISSAEIERAMLLGVNNAGTAAEKKRVAYRPPGASHGGASDSGRVAQMMRGDLDAGGASSDPTVTQLLASMQKNEEKERAEAATAAQRTERAASSLQERLRNRGEDEEKQRGEGAAGSTQPSRVHGEKAPCPATGWQYKDPKGNVQGPFTLEQMQKWFSKGAFKGNLPMRCSPDDRFIPLSELFPHPMIPFHRAPKRPT